MKIGAYNPRTGAILSENITGINFGNVAKGHHSVLPVLIRPEMEGEDIAGIEVYMQNNGGFNQTEFGHFVHPSFVQVKSYDTGMTSDAGFFYISDHFIQVPNPPDVSGGVSVNVHEDGYTDYVWLDVSPSTLETGGTSTINYRFIFEYS
jgi:hypothetical protein